MPNPMTGSSPSTRRVTFCGSPTRKRRRGAFSPGFSGVRSSPTRWPRQDDRSGDRPEGVSPPRPGRERPDPGSAFARRTVAGGARGQIRHRDPDDRRCRVPRRSRPLLGLFGVALASLAAARSPRHRESVTGRSWDLVIVDEAHVLKNARTEAYALVSRLTSRFLLLLTATPVENRLEELYNLVSLIRPGHLGGRREFLGRYDDRTGGASEAARRDVRALLGEIMIRNTRALSGVRLPPRFARTLLVTPDVGEGELYRHLVSALRALGPGGRTRLLLSVLLQEAGSSPDAVRATLERLRASDDRPREMLERLAPAIDCLAAGSPAGRAGRSSRSSASARRPWSLPAFARRSTSSPRRLPRRAWTPSAWTERSPSGVAAKLSSAPGSKGPSSFHRRRQRGTEPPVLPPRRQLRPPLESDAH